MVTKKLPPSAPGDRYGILTLLEKTSPKGANDSRWKVICDCGVIKEVPQFSMRNGNTISCGCYRKSEELLLKKRNTFLSNFTPKNLDSVIGIKFNRLTVLEYVGILGKMGVGNRSVFGIKVECECGSIFIANKTSVVRGLTTSCGCKKSENGAKNVAIISRNHRIKLGLDPEEPISSGSKLERLKFTKMSSDIKIRDDYTCAICNTKGGYLNTHHINTWSNNKTLRFDPKNLVTLCRTCHLDIAHSGNTRKHPDPVIAAQLTIHVLSKFYPEEYAALTGIDMDSGAGLFEGPNSIKPSSE